jgi:hypothetical protein
MASIVWVIVKLEFAANRRYRFRVTSISAAAEQAGKLKFHQKIMKLICKPFSYFRKKSNEEEQPHPHTQPDLLVQGRSTVSAQLKEVIIMSSLYTGAFLITCFFPILGAIISSTKDGRENIPFSIVLLSRIFNPLQGFFNMLVYTRPHVSSLRRSHGYSRIKAFWVTIFKYGGDIPHEGSRRRRLLRPMHTNTRRNESNNSRRESSRLVSVVADIDYRYISSLSIDHPFGDHINMTQTVGMGIEKDDGKEEERIATFDVEENEQILPGEWWKEESNDEDDDHLYLYDNPAAMVEKEKIDDGADDIHEHINTNVVVTEEGNDGRIDGRIDGNV